MRRVARVAALGVVLARGGAAASAGGLRAAGAGSRRDDGGCGGDGLVAAFAEDVAAVKLDAALAVGILVRRVARVAALGVVGAWGGAGASRRRSGRGGRAASLALDDRRAAGIGQQRAAVNVLALLAVRVLVRRVARVAALGVVVAWGGAGASRRRSGRGGRAAGLTLGDRLAAGIGQQRAAINVLALLAVRVLVRWVARVATLSIVVARSGAVGGCDSHDGGGEGEESAGSHDD